MNEEMNIYKLLDRLDEEVSGGKKVALTNKIVVDAGIITECITDIRMNLPDIIKKASQIAGERNKIIGQAKEDAGTGLAKAKEKCDQMIEEANQIASKTTADAKEDAANLINTATERSNEIISRAEEQAKRMVDESEVVISAKEYSEKLRNETEAKCRELLENVNEKADFIVKKAEEDAQNIMNKASTWSATLREKTTTYVDELLGNTDDLLVKNINDVRRLRSGFRNMVSKDDN